MLKNYIKIAWRNLFKHKIDSAISIGGLAVGLACCILLVTFVRFEWSYDSFHENSDRIYRVVRDVSNPNTGQVQKLGYTPFTMADAMKTTFPGIEQTARILGGIPFQIKVDNKYRSEEIFFADPEFFKMFSFPLVSGNSQKALVDPGSIVLTASKARQLFGRTDVIGETITVRFDNNEEKVFRVSGLAEFPPGNSSIKFNIVLPFNTYPDISENLASETWLMLRKEISAEQMEEQLSSFFDTHYNSGRYKFWLQPLSQAYFNLEVFSPFEQANKLYSLALAGIALIILAIACINFMSLTLSRMSGRSSEIGIRKAFGAGRGQLSGQFFGEVFVTCMLAFIPALMLAELLLPLFRQIVQKPVNIGLFSDPLLLVLLLVVLFVATLVTGGYPAFKLSGKKASAVLTSRTTSGRIPSLVKSLIVVQFTMAIAFIAVTFLMRQQMQFMFNRDLGYNPENVISIEAGGLQNLEKGAEIYQIFNEEARRIPGVKEISGSQSLFIIHESLSGFATTRYSIKTEQYAGTIYGEVADEHFLETMSIGLVEGRNFSLDRPSDIKEGIIVNQRMEELMGWENPIGQTIDSKWGNFKGKRVIGVMEDYNHEPLYHKIKPVVFMHRAASDQPEVRSILVSIENSSLSSTLDRLKTIWYEFFPEEPFNYTFLDDYVRRQYEEEQLWSRIMQAASTAAILLACFGLFGLAALAAARRTKEIGIRKVLGATIANIVGLLSKDFLKLVLLGFVIAVPIAWYAMNRWLADFAYRIEIGAGIFLLAGGAAVLIALATVSWQSIRAALANPAESLRSE